MAISQEMRRLQNKWRTQTAWPKRLEWIEIHGIRGWTGQRIDFLFPIVAVVGENGSGKSTVLQSAAGVYRSPNSEEDRYASDFFPDTPFERVRDVTIRFSYREGQQSQTRTVRKPSDRWRGNPERPKRWVEYVDLSRIQPFGARTGYIKLLKSGVTEGLHTSFDERKLGRFSQIMGRTYVSAGISLTSIDTRREIPVLQSADARYSGFHQGAGEIAAAELLAADFKDDSLVLIDEVESSLHPRAQRRLIHELARIAREKELQIVLTTHSPYVLEELPPEARIYLMQGVGGKSVVTGVSPEFAMTRMDEEQHPECDVYVEDARAGVMVGEALVSSERDLLSRVRMIPYGSASVGGALGMMASQRRFPRPSVVFLDGDQAPAPGCIIIPGEDAPERVVFDALQQKNWPEISQRVGRGFAETVDAFTRSMSLVDHHDWLRDAADKLHLGTDIIWQAMCASWAINCASQEDRERIVQPIKDALEERR
jgi:predicted ATPase